MNGLAMYEGYDEDVFEGEEEVGYDDTEVDDDDGLCKKCHGNGKYQVREEDGDEVTVSWKFCEPCGGTGFEKGDSYVD